MALMTMLAPAVEAAGAAGGPWLAAASALAPVAGKALGGGGPVGGGGPSRAESQTRTSVESIFDSSGWVVNFGEGASISASSQKPAAAVSQWVMLAIAGGALWLAMRSK